MAATYFTHYTVRFDGGIEIKVTEVDNSESLAIHKAKSIMKRNARILNQRTLDTARVVYLEDTNPLVP